MVTNSVRLYATHPDGYLGSANAVYNTARAGSSLWANTTDIVVYAGQQILGSTYYCYEGFITIETAALPNDAVIKSVSLVINGYADVTDRSPSLIARMVEWGTTLETGDWIAGASLSGNQEFGRVSYNAFPASYPSTNPAVWIEGNPALITPGQTAKFVLSSSQMEEGTAPGGKYVVWCYSMENGAYTPYLQVVYESEGGTSDQSLVARPFTTRAASGAAIALQSDEPLDWWFDGDTLVRGLRGTPDPQRHYIVNSEQPGISVNVYYDSEDTPDIVAALYRSYGQTSVRDGTYCRVYYPEEPTSPTQRVAMIDVSGNYMGPTQATTYAKSVYDRYNKTMLKGSIGAVGGLRNVTGQFIPAPLIKAGDWVEIADLPGHKAEFVTGTSYDWASKTVNLTVGNTEKREAQIPGISSLPERPTPFGQETGDYSTDAGTSGDDGTTGTEPEQKPMDKPPGSGGLVSTVSFGSITKPSGGTVRPLGQGLE